MINKKDYNIIKNFIHMSIVPISVKKLWFADKNFSNFYFNDKGKRQKK